MSFAEENFKFALLLFMTCLAGLDARSLAALAAIMQIVFLARSLRSAKSNMWSRHHWRRSLHACTTRIV